MAQLIENLSKQEQGVHPILVDNTWQVVKINYCQQRNVNNLSTIYKVEKDGLALTLLKGNCVLVTEDPIENELKTRVLEVGTSYYLPEKLRYNLIMKKRSELFAVLTAGEHPFKNMARPLKETEVIKIKQSINTEFKN